MNKILLISALIMTLVETASAQENKLSNNIAIGFQLSQYQKDFGFGINIATPYFAHKKLAFRLKSNIMYFEHTINNETGWTPYSNLSLGLIGVGGMVGDFIRLYGEGGVISVFPSSKFSAEKIQIGGYGLFGFEFFMNSYHNYFIEIGGIGIGAVADKIPNKPIYSNGLTISTGFRFVL